ncbi:MAG: hypothetical protein ABFD79_14490 [Phycisphaerales bacterium]
MDEPLTNGDNGKDINGRFCKGNKFGRGNPHAAKVSKLRAALLKAVKPKEIEAVIKKLLEQAKSGNPDAIKELLDRVIGKPVETDLIERLERLEELEEQRKCEL